MVDLKVGADFGQVLLARIEDACLNASAPPQQRWLDGWLVRYSPGKAKRARSINAVAAGRLSIAEKLRLAEPVFREAGLELVVRLTPFSQPQDLDQILAAIGMLAFDDTRVMVASSLENLPQLALPAGCVAEPTDHHQFAQAVGHLRGSPQAHRLAHSQRLIGSPVPYQGWLVRKGADVVACAQVAMEADMVGVYDVFTAPSVRGQGIAKSLCAQVLQLAFAQGARLGYLQVDSANIAARAVYSQLGFADAYSYHYRAANPAAAA